ncbi:hypothetical protein [Saccharococcus caldoxylosilyticus]|uniref:hypothetical protein n=1 Tax=Saccharococcus caldoxylosilyticus TaxID=81408 RepID=UPI001FCC1232|nr:hypothetical protein [Parageobacillus caldoxylosilyticus]BDG44795.1 hypothetical protein PcaKH35_31400 [Parageobacillus caldoxylosilyticus]
MVFRECWQVVFLFMYGRWGLHKLIAIHYINRLPQTICFGRQLTKGQEENFEWVYSIKREPQKFKNQKVLDYLKGTVEKSLKDNFFHNYNDYQTIDNIIKFFRELVSETKKHGTFLVNVSEVQKLLDVKKLYEATHKNIQLHHWIEFNLFDGMILTVPEFFAYTDIVNNWNILVDKIEQYKSAMADDSVPFIERKNNIENRRIRYEISSLSRILWVSSVTFVESYLYYLFYNLKQINYQPNSESGKSILQLQKVEDEEIIKSLVLPEFIKNKNNELDRLIKKYIEINKIRNRFIHPSAFHSSSNLSELLPLLTTTVNQVINTLEVCTKLVKMIDDYLPENLKILVWWDRVSHPVFKEYKKGDITNPESPLSKIKYTDYL